MKPKMVNANPETIEALYLKKDWQRILKLRNNVRIPTSNPLSVDNYVHDQPDSIWEIIERDGIIVHENDSYLAEIQQEPLSVLDNPSDIFFVNSDIKKKYLDTNAGVFISTRKSQPATALKASWEKVLNKGESFSWDGFFRNDVINKVIPSNSMIIVDRYMFSNLGEGVQNLMDILDAVLPQSMRGEYHILLVTDKSQIKHGGNQVGTNEAIAGINRVVPSLERPYGIVFEIIMVEPLRKRQGGYSKTEQEQALVEFYQATHDRHIISNYFIVSADHGLCAVTESRSGALVASFKQTVKFESIYAGIDNKYQDIQSLPAKSASDFIESINLFIGSISPKCVYSINGEKQDVKKIKNRLLF